MYKILGASTVGELEEKVNDHLVHGYTLHGQFSVAQKTSYEGIGDTYLSTSVPMFYQAVLRR